MNEPIKTEIDENLPSPTTEELEAICAKLTIDQIRFVIARNEHSSDKATAEFVGISPHTVKGWKYDGVPIDEAVRLLALDGLIVAASVRRRNLAKAMLVKVGGLDSDDERTRQGVATELIEWEMGKAQQRLEHSGTGEGGAIKVERVAPLTEAEKQAAMDAFYRRVLAETGTRDTALDQPVE